MRSSETKKRNMIIGSLLGVLLLMVVGYAAFSSVLNISGTSGISSNWKILITNITEKNKVGSASTAINEETKKPEITGIGTLTATFKTNLVSPGDSIEYDITVTNQGSIDAKLDKITPESLSIKDGAIKFTRSAVGFEVGDVLKAGESKVLTVKVEYDESVTSQPESTKGTFTVTLDYSQNGGGSDTPVVGETAAEKLIATEVTSGDGLYADEYETGRYIYKGGNPDNYINFNNEIWRILSVESDGTLKIMKATSIGTMPFDSKGARTTGYCSQGEAPNYGCNAWAISPNFTNSIYTGTVDKNSELNTYLNTTYYNSLSPTAKKQIQNHKWYIGGVSDIDGIDSLATTILQEKKATWIGKIALLSVSDMIQANTNTKQCGTIEVSWDNYDSKICKNTNYISTMTESASKYNSVWMVSPELDNFDELWIINGDKGIADDNDFASEIDQNGVLPAVYLTPNITLDGEGTSGNPYTIVS